MTRYEVDVPAVEGLSSQVSGVAGDVRATVGQLGAATWMDLGDEGLAAAVSVFGQAWAGFTEGAAQAIDATAGAISAASAGYVRVDESVVADLGMTSAFVAAVAAGADGEAALDVAAQSSQPASRRGPR